MKIREIMTDDVRTARLDDTLDRIAQIMKTENVGAVPVLDQDQELCGLITDRDIVVRCIAEQRDPADTQAEDIISEDVQTISPDADVEEAARMMARKQVRRLPVCDANGELLGMISLGDLAVKSEDMDVSAEALEDISQGVRSGREAVGNALPHRAGTRSAHAVEAAMDDNEEFDLEFSDEKDASVAATSRRTRPSDIARQQPRSSRAGEPGLPGAKEAGAKAERSAERGLRESAPGKQGITTHAAEEENQRNSRVVPIRKEATASAKRRSGTRKTG